MSSLISSKIDQVNRNIISSDNALASLIRAERDGYSLSREFYCDEDIFHSDMERIVGKKWLLIDHVSRIPEQGQYFVYDIADDSIIIVRESKNKVNAFYNVCRHRGSVICTEKEGKRNSLVCPYHSWTYKLDGTLLAARSMPEDFDYTENALHSCHIKIHHGFIFINLDQNAPVDFESEFSQFEEQLIFHGFSGAKVATRASYPTAANWKLVVENFIECYHCASAHPEFSSLHPRDALIACGGGANSGSGEAAERFKPLHEAWEVKAREMGRPIGICDDDEFSTHLKMFLSRPHNQGILSETQDGQPAAGLMGKRTEFDRGRMHMSFGPLNHIIACNDFAALIIFTPRGVKDTDVEVIWIVDEKTEYVDEDKIRWLWDTTTIQDKTIVENNQRGINSTRCVPGRFSEQEKRVATFKKWYLNNLALASVHPKIAKFG
ncbi:MAG: phenylpropionate dioxygenase-like ring-hydroxylating dioxygenase large terminal subunit [Candidatus Azotimanducaceae bacterium]|jgi:phenylpropionate dioxygenase-like ring-hydroxylating dioxygenase large terminal subunit